MDISGLKQYYSLHSSRKFICGFSLLMQKASFNRKSTGSVSLAIMFTLIALVCNILSEAYTVVACW